MKCVNKKKIRQKIQQTNERERKKIKSEVQFFPIQSTVTERVQERERESIFKACRIGNNEKEKRIARELVFHRLILINNSE